MAWCHRCGKCGNLANVYVRWYDDGCYCEDCIRKIKKEKKLKNENS
jgi:hypothetical protein